LNDNPEGLNQGCTHGFIITFAAEKDRDGCLKPPAHYKFVEIVKDRLEQVLVIDFWRQSQAIAPTLLERVARQPRATLFLLHSPGPVSRG